jgi:hypothetical protein
MRSSSTTFSTASMPCPAQVTRILSQRLEALGSIDHTVPVQIGVVLMVGVDGHAPQLEPDAGGGSDIVRPESSLLACAI